MLEIKVKYLKSFSEKTIGLTGLKIVKPVFFKTRLGIHTFGMKVPIDVFILDKNHRIVNYRRNLEPGKIFIWNPKYNNVLETPTGLLKLNKKLKIIF